MLAVASLVFVLGFAALPSGVPLVTVPDPQATLHPETTEQRLARHTRVANTRSETVLILHRGAWEFAPENTLAAIRAGFQLGARGVELDFRRTADGVIVLFHDDRLERLLDGVGTVEECFYEELLLHTFHALPATAAEAERVPVLRDVLQLVRDHAGLLHLDIKDPSIDGELLHELRAADMLDHVVAYNDYNSDAFLQAGITTLPFRGSLMENGRDVALPEVESMLKRPGSLVILDDPRATLSVMGSQPTTISPLPAAPLGTLPPVALAALESTLRGSVNQVPTRLAAVRMAIYAPERLVAVAGELCQSSNAEVRRAVAWNLGMLAKHRPALISDATRTDLLRLLHDAELAVRAEASVACGRARIAAAVPVLVKLLAERPTDIDQWTDDPNRWIKRQQLIEARARYAFGLGLVGEQRVDVTEVLVDAVRHRGVHQNPAFVGVDGAMAAWALGKLRAAESVGALRDALLRDDHTLAPLALRLSPHERLVRTPGMWDYQIRAFILPALAQIGSDEAFAALEDTVNSSGNESSPLGPDVRAAAADAMLVSRGRDSIEILAGLITHSSPEVKRCAVLACLKRADSRYRALLGLESPWAVPWWDAQQRPHVRPQQNEEPR